MSVNRFLAIVTAAISLLLFAVLTFLPTPTAVAPATNSDSPSGVVSSEQIFAASQNFSKFIKKSGRKVRPSRKTFGVFTTTSSSNTADLDDISQVYPPIDFTASPQTGGISLTWVADIRNPINGLEYKLTRWAGDGSATPLGSTKKNEYFDVIDCEGTPYRYRLRTILNRPSSVLDGSQVRAESAPVAATATMPRRTNWTTEGLTEDGSIMLFLNRPGRPQLGPFKAWPGAPIGNTEWVLEGLNVRDTTISVQTSIPRFDALGRRVIIEGRPAERTRSLDQSRLLASMRLTDPCGTALDLELLLPLSLE